MSRLALTLGTLALILAGIGLAVNPYHATGGTVAGTLLAATAAGIQYHHLERTER